MAGKTSAQYRSEYETSAALLPELIRLGDETSFKQQLDKANDYNRPILEDQARNLEENRQILNQYSTSLNNPETAGLDVARQMRMRDYDTSKTRQQAQALGAYYNARQGTVADTVKAWKDAYDVRYRSAEAAANQLKEQWQMAFQEEQEAARRAEAQREYNLKAEENEPKGTTFGDALSSAGRRMLSTGVSREQEAAQLASDYGMKYDDVIKQVKGKYPDGWESRFYKAEGGSSAFRLTPIARNHKEQIVKQLTSGTDTSVNQSNFQYGLNSVMNWLGGTTGKKK